VRRAWLTLMVSTVLALPSLARAEPTVRLRERVENLSLGPSVDVLEDPSGSLTLSQVRTRERARFRPHRGSVPNFGFTRSVYWFRARVDNGALRRLRLLLEIRYPMLDEVDFYAFAPDGKVLASVRTGNARPWSTRAIAHRHFLFPFELEPRQAAELFVRVRSNATVQVPLTLWTLRAFIEADPWASMIQGVYAGFMLMMVLYNFFLYFSLRERMYLLYVPMVLGQLAFQFILHGQAFALFWPSYPALNRLLPPVLIPLVTWAANAFATEFLELRQRDPKLHQLCRAVRFACLATSVLSPLVRADTGIMVGSALAAIASATLVAAFARLRRVALRSVWMLAIAWTPLLVGTFLLVAEKFGLLSRGFFTENLVQIGSAFEVVVLSLALADRIHGERTQKLAAQELALEHERAAQRAQQEALLVQRRANETLENRVKERTHELAEANARLAELSTIDPLTGLKNRRFFAERFHDEFARGLREGTALAVLLVDVDLFHHINDRHGHMVGDLCLSAVADVLAKSVSRTTDSVARYGGDEFAVLLPNTSQEGARKVAEHVRSAVEALTIEADGELVALSVSIGAVSAVPQRGQRRDAFLKQVERTLAEAKAQGFNRVHLRECSAE
jgi:diguanylate cyclase